MALTREEVEQSLRKADEMARDASLPSGERQEHRRNATRFAAALRTMGPQTTPLTDAVDPAKGTFLGRSAKVGLTNWLYKVVNNSPLSPVVNEIFDVELDDTLEGNPRVDEMRVLEAIERKAHEWFGADISTAPKGNIERYTGIAIEAISSDPVMSLLGGRSLLSTAANLGMSSASAVTGAGTYETVAGIAEGLGASPDVQDTLGKLAAATVSTGTGTVGGFVTGGAARARNTIEELGTRDKIGAKVDQATSYLATRTSRTVIDDIVATDPNIGDKIRAITSISEMVKGFKPTAGIGMYADNPVIRKNMETLLKEYPAFRARVNADLADARGAIDRRHSLLFGKRDPSNINPSKIETAIRNAQANYGDNLDSVTRRIENIDTAMDNVLARVRTGTDAVAVGAATKNLIDQKEAAVKKLHGIEYERLITEYSAKGLKFPDTSVASMWGLVDVALDAGLFTQFPTLVKKMNTLLRPTITPAAESPFSLGGALGGARPPANQNTVTFRSLSLEQLDSLKQSLNATMRDSYGDSKVYPLLKQLKTTLNAEIEKLPGFGAAYRANDASYYEKLGLPMGAEGLAQLDSLKFSETVGNYLAKPERAIDFINFVGDAGVPLVRDSILMRLQKTSFDKEGNFRPANYANFLNDNKRVIDTVPGMAQELRDIGGTVRRMEVTRGRLQQEHTAYAEKQADNLLKATEKLGLETVIAQILKSPEKRDRYFNTVTKLDADSAGVVRRGIRSALLRRALEARYEGNAADARRFMREHEATFNKWFGTAYTKNLDTLADLSRILESIRPDSLGFAFSYKETDALQRATGTSASGLGSILRDRISSLIHKVSILGSRWFTQKSAIQRDTEIMNLLLDPAGLEAIAKKARATSKGGVGADLGLDDVNKILSEVSKYVSGGALRTITVAQNAAEIAERTPEVDERAAATPMPQ